MTRPDDDSMPGRARRAALTLLAIALAGPASAEADGAYPAMLVCDRAPGADGLRETLTVEITAGRATYAFRGAGGSESGRGALEGRKLVLTGAGRARGFAYSARYVGEVGGRGGTLTGRQTGRAGSRACQLVLGNGRD